VKRQREEPETERTYRGEEKERHTDPHKDRERERLTQETESE